MRRLFWLAALLLAAPACAQSVLTARIRPTAPTTIYISPTGSDANTATQCQASAPCRNPQYVLDWLFINWDHAGQPLTVQWGCNADKTPFTWPGFQIRGPFVGHYGTPSQNGAVTLVFQGDPTCPSVIIDGSTTAGGPTPSIVAMVNENFHIRHFVLQTGTSGQPCLVADLRSNIAIHDMNFGQCSGGAVNAINSTVIFNGGTGNDITISGNAPWFIYADENATVRVTFQTTVTCVGAPSFGSFTVGSARKSNIDFSGPGMTFNCPNATGYRWITYDGSISISVPQGSNPNAFADAYFPGSSAGFDRLGQSGTVY